MHHLPSKPPPPVEADGSQPAKAFTSVPLSELRAVWLSTLLQSRTGCLLLYLVGWLLASSRIRDASPEIVGLAQLMGSMNVLCCHGSIVAAFVARMRRPAPRPELSFLVKLLVLGASWSTIWELARLVQVLCMAGTSG